MARLGEVNGMRQGLVADLATDWMHCQGAFQSLGDIGYKTIPKVFGNFTQGVGRVWRSGCSVDECSGRSSMGRGHGSDYCSIAGTVAIIVKKMEARIYFRHFISMPPYSYLNHLS